jgi:hypothetical protein
MSTRNSGFTRVPMDLYQTPAWVVGALAEHINLKGLRVWEPAAGEGKMVEALQSYGAIVLATDVKNHGLDVRRAGQVFRGEFDFTIPGHCPWINSFELLITNPPYGARGETALRFIDLGLERIGPRAAMALLLPVDFDSAKTRAKFFADCPRFLAKIVLTKRIRWFEPEAGKKNCAPSANHAWFVYGSTTLAPSAPRLLYAPTQRAA